MAIRMLLSEYSFAKIVAPKKALAVCPEGKEFAAEPSGRTSLVEYFKVCTVPNIIIPPVSIKPTLSLKLCLLFIPIQSNPKTAA